MFKKITLVAAMALSINTFAAGYTLDVRPYLTYAKVGTNTEINLQNNTSGVQCAAVRVLDRDFSQVAQTKNVTVDGHRTVGIGVGRFGLPQGDYLAEIKDVTCGKFLPASRADNYVPTTYVRGFSVL